MADARVENSFCFIATCKTRMREKLSNFSVLRAASETSSRLQKTRGPYLKS